MGDSTGRMTTFLVLVVVAIAVGGVLGRLPPGGTQSSPSTLETVETPDDESESVRVHVSGMVVAPGVVHVPGDAIVADAIDAAGGLLSDAVVDQINLAAPVAPGGRIVVPGPGDDQGGGVGPTGEAGLVSINRATAVELEALPGVGPVLAERIVAFRDENGGFEVVEDLLEVPGIGEAKLAAMRDQIAP